ncbi:MAG TPA: hypothetical protein VGM92_03365 [Candidatus Kapabacteria bacterium]|jgi:hypothetical protein
MSIFTILLFFFLTLALWPLLTRNSGRRELQRRRDAAEDRLETAGSICVAAARDAFGVELDHSLESIDTLDAMIVNGWPEAIDVKESPGMEPNADMESNMDMGANTDVGVNADAGTNPDVGTETDATFLLGAYLGDVFVRQNLAEWRWEDDKTLLYFEHSNKTVSPFELLEEKLKAPLQIHLPEVAAQWQSPEISETDRELGTA